MLSRARARRDCNLISAGLAGLCLRITAGGSAASTPDLQRKHNEKHEGDQAGNPSLAAIFLFSNSGEDHRRNSQPEGVEDEPIADPCR